MKIYRAVGIVALAFGVASPAALAQGKAKGAAKGRAKAQARQQQKQNEQEHRQSAEQMRFYGLDKNNDGIITRAEWSGNDQSFREHDTNGDGILSGNEVRPAGETFEGDQGRSLVRFDQADRNGDGRIERDEWIGNTAAFNRADRNADGVITRDEFSTALADRAAGTSGAEMNQANRSRREEITARFNRADRNADGRITRDEWTGNPTAFDRMDRNGDGLITRAEFSTAVADRAARTSEAPASRNATRAYQAGYDKGLVEGRQAGREDKNVNGGKWDLEGQRELEQADSGYRPELGDRADYQAGYRAAFRLGYREGFGPRR
jgi:Ca2+-binding EF-hand superfamily protein